MNLCGAGGMGSYSSKRRLQVQSKIVTAFVLHSSKLLIKWGYLATQLCSRYVIYGFDGEHSLCVCVYFL